MKIAIIKELFVQAGINEIIRFCQHREHEETKDLKSIGHCYHAGSIPASGTKSFQQYFEKLFYFSYFTRFSYNGFLYI